VRVSTIDPGMVQTDFSLVRFRGDAQRAAQVYQDLTPLTPADVADAAVWALTRPAHVQVAEMVILSHLPGLGTHHPSRETGAHEHQTPPGRTPRSPGPTFGGRQPPPGP
jgi:hypothetical protein